MKIGIVPMFFEKIGFGSNSKAQGFTVKDLNYFCVFCFLRVLFTFNVLNFKVFMLQLQGLLVLGFI
jgi:hypothetical protein